jgi:hypothetical protein
MVVGSGKWEVGRGKWDVGRRTWEVGRGTWDVESRTWKVGRDGCYVVRLFLLRFQLCASERRHYILDSHT